MIARYVFQFVGKDLSGDKVLEAKGVDPAAPSVGREGHDFLVTAQFSRAVTVELVSFCHGRDIEHDLFLVRSDASSTRERVGVAFAVAPVILVVFFTVGNR